MALLYEYYNTGVNDYVYVYNAVWVAQTFTVGITGHRITSIKLEAHRVGSPGTLTVSVRATDGNGHPTGEDLTSGTINANTFGVNFPGSWYEVTLTSCILEPNTKYAIVYRALTGNGANHVRLEGDKTTPSYGGGNREDSSDSGGSWSSNTGFDFMFEVWGPPPPVAYTQTISEILGMSDSVPAPKGAFKITVPIEKLDMVDSIPSPKAAFKIAFPIEKLGMLDSATRSFPLKVTIMEILGFRDRLESRKHAGKIGDLPDDTITGGA